MTCALHIDQYQYEKFQGWEANRSKIGGFGISDFRQADHWELQIVQKLIKSKHELA